MGLSKSDLKYKWDLISKFDVFILIQ